MTDSSAATGTERTTIRDVAAAAGVSVTTVSYYLNRPERLAPETAARVRQAVAKLKFQARPKLRKIQSDRNDGASGMLALLIPDRDPRSCRTPLSRGLVAAAIDYSAQYGVPILPVILRPDGTLPECITRQRVAGVICRCPSKLPLDLKLPTVALFERMDRHTTQDVVCINNMALGELAATKLLEHGRRRVLIPVNLYEQHHGRMDISVRILTFGSTFTAGGGEVVQQKVELDNIPGQLAGFDSIFAPADDLMEFDLLRLLYRNGIDPVNQVEYMPFFNAPQIPDTLEGDLNYIYASPDKIIRQAAETLLWRLQTPDAAPKTLLVGLEYHEFRATARLFSARGRLFGAANETDEKEPQ